MMGGELVALISVIGITLSGVLTTLFHSRCSTIRCCGTGIVCEREVVEEEVTAQPVNQT
tara:strand:- start:295 stop:471 length:177 start_codon:yes stop_codon:yes gene_type:complete